MATEGAFSTAFDSAFDVSQETAVAGGVMGWDLYSTLAEQAQYVDYYKTVPPVACPNDGEPLRLGPPNQPGVRFCPMDGWQYPRDWDPESHSGM